MHNLVVAVAEVLEIFQVQNLGANMIVQADKLNGRQALCLADYIFQYGIMDAELVFRRTGGDILMRMGRHVGIHAEADGGHLSAGCCQPRQHMELGGRFHIESAYAGIQAQLDFPIGLSYTGVEDGLAGLQGCLHLSAAHTVCSEAEAGDVIQDNGIVVGLHGIVHLGSWPVQYL